MKRIIQISAFVLFAIALAALMGFIYLERENQMLEGIKVRICRNTEKGFLNDSALYKTIDAIDSIRTKKIKQLNTNMIEAVMLENPYAEKVDAYVNINNQLMVNVREKLVVLRVFNQDNSSFYIDENGGILPLSKQFSPRVLIANGYINIPYIKGFDSVFDSIYKGSQTNEGPGLSQLFALTKLINQNKFLKAQISQIYVNSKKEFDLIPELGNQLIQLGSIENAAEKLDKLEIFYKKALVKEGWEKYKTINLKYKGQVVCTKR
jgi:cell division protein FtsQ